MRTFLFAALVITLILAACAPGTESIIPTQVPGQIGTAAAQAPTLGVEAATRASGAVNAAATQAAQAAGTLVPSAQTAAAPLQTTVATLVAPVAGSATPAVGTVEVKLSEYKIDSPTMLKSGAVTFRVTNAGSITHSFVVEGQGLKQRLEKDLQPGETGTLQVNLQPGLYDAYCPIDGHKDEGMKLKLTVLP